MKFNMPEAVPECLQEPELKVGNVYLSKNRRKTYYWVVFALDNCCAHLFGLGKEGEITSTASYGRHVFEGSKGVFKPRQVVGFCHGLDELSFEIELFDSLPEGI